MHTARMFTNWMRAPRPTLDDHRPGRPRVAILRGEALNPFELQAYGPLVRDFELLAIGRRRASYETNLIGVPTRLLPSLAQIPHSSRAWHRASAMNLRARDSDRLLGLKAAVRGCDILHGAETAIALSEQAAEIVAAEGSRLVLTCWETIPFRFDDDPFLSRRKTLVRSATSRFIAVTQRAKAALIDEGVAADSVVVIPAAVDCDRFHPDVRSDLRQRWNVPTSAPLLLYVGRLIQEKGLVELLRAFAAIRSPRAHLAFVGNGNQRERLAVAAATLGVSDRVHLVPSASYAEIPCVYAAADLVVAPSLPTPYWEEQFGMVLVEAMASGRALVTTTSGAISEVVGDCAVLVPPYDIRALTYALERLLQEPQERMALGLRARDRASHLYSIPRVASQLADCYRGVLSR